jgi:ATP-dependent Clp protease protease subunit
MNIKLKNQHKIKDKGIFFDRDNPSRTIVLSSEIDDFIVSDILQYISDINDYDDDGCDNIIEYSRKPIKLIINSFGGSVYDGFALIGVIENSKTPIHTYCYGSAMSMALLVLTSGHKRFGHRLATFMYHECLDEMSYDKLSNLKENLEETKRIMDIYDGFLMEKTSLKKKQLDDIKRLKKDWYISPDDALKYKIIDKII